MKPPGVNVLIPIQVLLALLAIPSGVLLVTSPSGEAIGAQTILPYLRQQLPFLSDFTAAGIFLLVVYGFLPIVFSYGLWTQKRWAWTLTLLLGLAEIVWIGTEVVLFYNLGFFFFYSIIAVMGAVTVALCLLPSVRKFYSSYRKIVTREQSAKSPTA